MGLLSPAVCSDVEAMPRLDETGRLAARLEHEFAGAEVYTRESASLATFFDAVARRMDRFGKILFATHAILGGQFAGLREPALLLSNVPAGTDSWLRMRNIAGLKMNAEVVVLLACQTGLGRIISGEGTMGMGRAFQLAGARSVLMSLWMVEESASVRLAGAFFEHLAEGRSKIEALRMAREELRKAKDGAYDHPFFWAGFILAGER
jgi:CHAT domain-containing protein